MNTNHLIVVGIDGSDGARRAPDWAAQEATCQVGGPGDLSQVTRTGRLAPTMRFARRLSDRGIPIGIRFVLVPGLTDEVDNVAGVAEVAASLPTVARVEVLPSTGSVPTSTPSWG